MVQVQVQNYKVQVADVDLGMGSESEGEVRKLQGMPHLVNSPALYYPTRCDKSLL